MFSLANFLNNQVEKSQQAELNKRINKAAKPLTAHLYDSWCKRVKEIRARDASNDSDISSDLNHHINDLTQSLKLDPDTSEVKDISDRIVQLTLQKKENSAKPLFLNLSVLVARSRL